ncbi:MAG: hypothetical protein AAB601_02440 [Patescibacteria group bacterium]|mgnify:CR=1 FL=1
MKEKQFFVIVFQIGGEVFVDYGWEFSEAQFVRDVHYRVEHPKKYPKYRGLPTARFFNYEVRDITRYAEKKAKNNDVIARIVEKLRRRVGAQPVR